MKKPIKLIILLALTLSTRSFADDLKLYCQNKGGTPIVMSAQFDTSQGYINGFKGEFCQFNVKNNKGIIGLKTFGSAKQNLAATYAKTLKPVTTKDTSGNYSNPSLNLCKKLGGSQIAFAVNDGGFTDNNGQTDICVFGDGSMISAWTLIYISRSTHKANFNYTKVRDNIKSYPMQLAAPI